MKAIMFAERAASYAVSAQKAQRFPALFFGLSGEYVHTPRPVQSQPLFGSRFDYVNVVYTFGIRQSLNFGVMNAKVAQIEYQQKEAEYSKSAIGQALMIEVANTVKDYTLAKNKKEKLADALQTSKEWLRKEQIDYDLGLGELKNLVEALKTNLELDAEYKQAVFDFTVKGAAVLKASGKFNN
jgi:outer membrane protein